MLIASRLPRALASPTARTLHAWLPNPSHAHDAAVPARRPHARTRCRGATIAIGGGSEARVAPASGTADGSAREDPVDLLAKNRLRSAWGAAVSTATTAAAPATTAAATASTTSTTTPTTTDKSYCDCGCYCGCYNYDHCGCYCYFGCNCYCYCGCDCDCP